MKALSWFFFFLFPLHLLRKMCIKGREEILFDLHHTLFVVSKLL